MPVMVPEITVPFFSSTVTVSELRRWRNLGGGVVGLGERGVREEEGGRG